MRPLSTLLVLAGLVPWAAAQTVAIDFEFYPGQDGKLGTGDDIPIVAPLLFSSQTIQLTDEFATLGILFEPIPGLNDRNEVLLGSTWTPPPAHTPPNLLGSGPTHNLIEWRFTVPVTRVSALVGIFGGPVQGEMTIFDAAGNVLGSAIGEEIVVSLSSIVPIARVEVRGIGAWPAIDNLEFDVGGATAYCTSKVNSFGCTPTISGSGNPSAAATSGFTLDCAMVRNNKPGLLFYKANGAQAALTFQCGTLCVGPTNIKRTPAISSGGNAPPANDCSGLYSLDMNAFASGLLGGSPDPALKVAGTTAHAQYWGRDQGFPAPCNTTLSDGAVYTIAP